MSTQPQPPCGGEGGERGPAAAIDAGGVCGRVTRDTHHHHARRHPSVATITIYHDDRYRFTETLLNKGSGKKEWIERGIGEVKLLKHKESQKIRMLMRQEKTMKVIVNHVCDPRISLQVSTRLVCPVVGVTARLRRCSPRFTTVGAIADAPSPRDALVAPSRRLTPHHSRPSAAPLVAVPLLDLVARRVAPPAASVARAAELRQRPLVGVERVRLLGRRPRGGGVCDQGACCDRETVTTRGVGASRARKALPSALFDMPCVIEVGSRNASSWNRQRRHTPTRRDRPLTSSRPVTCCGAQQFGSAENAQKFKEAFEEAQKEMARIIAGEDSAEGAEEADEAAAAIASLSTGEPTAEAGAEPAVEAPAAEAEAAPES